MKEMYEKSMQPKLGYPDQFDLRTNAAGLEAAGTAGLTNCFRRCYGPMIVIGLGLQDQPLKTLVLSKERLENALAAS